MATAFKRPPHRIGRDRTFPAYLGESFQAELPGKKPDTFKVDLTVGTLRATIFPRISMSRIEPRRIGLVKINKRHRTICIRRHDYIVGLDIAMHNISVMQILHDINQLAKQFLYKTSVLKP